MKPDAAAGKRAEIVAAFKVRCFASPFSSPDNFFLARVACLWYGSRRTYLYFTDLAGRKRRNGIGRVSPAHAQGLQFLGEWRHWIHRRRLHRHDAYHGSE